MQARKDPVANDGFRARALSHHDWNSDLERGSHRLAVAESRKKTPPLECLKQQIVQLRIGCRSHQGDLRRSIRGDFESCHGNSIKGTVAQVFGNGRHRSIDRTSTVCRRADPAGTFRVVRHRRSMRSGRCGRPGRGRRRDRLCPTRRPFGTDGHGFLNVRVRHNSFCDRAMDPGNRMPDDWTRMGMRERRRRRRDSRGRWQLAN